MSRCRALALSLIIAIGVGPAASNAAPTSAAQSPPDSPEARIIDKWRGTWIVTSIRRAPAPVQEISYEETFDWTLDGRFLRSETTRKSDGSKSMTVFWFDLLTRNYRFVIFDSAGFALELPPPVWNEATQTMEWESGRFSPTSYAAHATFKDPDTIEWKSLWRDWKGSPILELEGVSRRRK